MRKTIIYVGAMKLPSGNAAAQRVTGNAKILRDLGYRLVLVGYDSFPTARKIVRRGSYAKDGFHSLSINVGTGRISKIGRRLSAWPILRLLRTRIAGPGAAVICYNYASLAQWQIQIACWLRGSAFCPDATEWYGADGSNVIKDALKWVDTTIRMRVLNKLSDAIVTTSPFLEKFYGSGKPLLKLPTLFDRIEIGPSVNQASDGPIRLVYAGTPFNLNARKPDPSKMKERLDLTIAMLAAVNEPIRFTLDVYGLTAKQYLRVFPEHAGHVSSPWLRFHGSVPHAKILQVVKEADFTTFLRENHRVNLAGFPGKFSESVTCGTPVITNLLGSVVEFALPNQNCILVYPGDPDRSRVVLLELYESRKTTIPAMKGFCASVDTFDYRSWLDVTRPFAAKVFA